MSCLQSELRVLAISGSVREAFQNKKLLNASVDIIRKKGMYVDVVDFKEVQIPCYDGDLEEKSGVPKHVKRFRKLLQLADGVIIASPNYNSSLSGVHKNALYWASRAEDSWFSKDAFIGKRFLLMIASSGKSGGSEGLPHLRQI